MAGKKILGDAGRGPAISDQDLALLSGLTSRHIRRLIEDGTLPSFSSKLCPRDPAICALFAHVRAKARIDEERHLKLKEERQALERANRIADGKILTLGQWEFLTSETLPPMDAWVSDLLKTEIPATCSGRDEASLREFCLEKYHEFRRDMRAVELRYDSGAVVAAGTLES